MLILILVPFCNLEELLIMENPLPKDTLRKSVWGAGRCEVWGWGGGRGVEVQEENRKSTVVTSFSDSRLVT